MFTVNGRFRCRAISGVERYASEVVSAFKSNPRVLEPAQELTGAKGHIWEQFVLPAKIGRNLLWSPCNIGPIVTHRQIVTVHDVIVLEHPEWFSRSFYLAYRAILPTLIARAQHIIAVSEFTKSRIATLLNLNPAKITTILNGVGTGFFPRDAEKIAECLKRHGISETQYVLALGASNPRKNVNRLLAAWKLVNKPATDACLVVIGARRQASFPVHKITLAANGVRLLGAVSDEDLACLYSGASCFVYPSLYEGFGLPVLEALSCGTHTIASRGSSITEIAGPNTTLVDPYCIEGIASAITKSLNLQSRDNDLSRSGQAYASAFTWKRTAMETERLLLSFS